MIDSNSIIAERLVQTREALGLSQAELCRAIGIAPNRWNQYESGERRITVAIAGKLKQQFGISFDWIYVGDQSSLPKRVTDKLLDAAQ